MGRNAKPIELHLFDNKKHLTKSEIEERKKAQIKLGDKNFIMPTELENKFYAISKWNEVINIFVESELDLVSTSDTGIIARYCLTYEEYIQAAKILDQFVADNGEILCLDFETYIKMQKVVDNKNNILTKIEDKLFLNPQAKIKTTAIKKKEESEDPLAKLGLGNV